MTALRATPPAESRGLIDLLEGRLRPTPASFRNGLLNTTLGGEDATVALRMGDNDDWSLRVDAGRGRLFPGLFGGAATTIYGEPDALAAVIKGTQSGVKSFLDGTIRVRGNIALAMQLEGLMATRARPKRFPKPATVRAGSVDTFYLEAGEGPPVVLLHGLGATNASMLSTLWDLSRDHRVLAPDLPGFGASDKPVRAYDPEFFAGWLRRFMDATGIKRATLVGNSMGGRVALEMGLRHPERVDKLVLLCPSPAFLHGREFVPLVRLLRPELAFVPILLPHTRVARLARAMFSKPERLADAWYDAFADEFLRVFNQPRGRIAFFSAARQVYLEPASGIRGFWDRLPALRTPALFIWGERDRLVPPGFARHVSNALPKAASVVLPDCGHVPQYELPEQTHRHIRRFLRA